MKIVIETRYNIGDIVYAYWNGRFTEFKIQNIVINHYDYKYRPEIENYWNHLNNKTMDKDIKELYQKKMEELRFRAMTCDYSDNSNLIDLIVELTDIVGTILDEQ